MRRSRFAGSFAQMKVIRFDIESTLKQTHVVMVALYPSHWMPDLAPPYSGALPA